MPLNPNIALQTQGIQLPDFAGAYQGILNNRAKREGLEHNRQLYQAQMRNIQSQEEQRTLENKQRQDYSTAIKGNADFNTLMSIDPKTTMDIQKTQSQLQKDELEMKSKQFELNAKKADRAIQIVSSIADDATLNAGLETVASDPDMLKAIPPEIILKLRTEGLTPENKATIRGFKYRLLEAKETLEEERQQIRLKMDQDKAERDAADAAATLPGKVAESKGKEMTLEERKRYDGMTASEKAKFDADRADAAQRVKDAAAGRAVTMRGQDMTDRRAKESNAIAAKPMSQESAKVFSIAQTMIPEIEMLKKALSESPRGTVAGILSGTDTNLSRLVDNVADKIGRLRSGGAINKDEAARFKAQIVRGMDMFSGDPGPAIDALTRIEQEANTIAGKMSPATATQGPKVGTVEDGHVFLGGDPANPKSWKKQ